MHIIVCMKQLADGSINPFDASALETALRLRPDKITILTMGPLSAKPLLEEYTRLGPVEAVLISGREFAGADTLATALALSTWIRSQEYDLILCGRQSIDGETAQVGPEIARMLGIPVVTRALELRQQDNQVHCKKRREVCSVEKPALVTMERSCVLRFPSLFSSIGSVRVIDREELGLGAEVCGLQGSPTQVIQSFEKSSDRTCRMIQKEELRGVISRALQAGKEENTRKAAPCNDAEENDDAKIVMKSGEVGEKLSHVWITDEILLEEAEKIAEHAEIVSASDLDAFVEKVRTQQPETVLFPADWHSRELAPQAAAALQTGLCADCTELLVEDGELHMIRPAFGGKLFAKIRCRRKPVMATVRTALSDSREDLIFAIGKGALPHKEQINACAELWKGEVAASRAAVEAGGMEYECQVGLTGKTVAPKVYLALGISGAVHHLAGMDRSGTVIAVNNDPEADIFDHADYGVVCDIEEILTLLNHQ